MPAIFIRYQTLNLFPNHWGANYFSKTFLELITISFHAGMNFPRDNHYVPFPGAVLETSDSLPTPDWMLELVFWTYVLVDPRSCSIKIIFLMFLSL